MGDVTRALRALGCSLLLIRKLEDRRRYEGFNFKCGPFEDSELGSLLPAAGEVVVASLKRGAITGKQGYEVAVDKTIAEVNPDDYAILVLPGGKAPAVVRKEAKALKKL